MEAKKVVLTIEKGLQPLKVFTAPAIDYLTRNGAICSRPCFCVQQQSFHYSGSYKWEAPKISSKKKPTYQIDSLKKEINKKLFAKTDSLVNKTLSYPRIKLSSSQTLLLDDVKTGVLLSDLTQQFRRKSADVPDI